VLRHASHASNCIDGNPFDQCGNYLSALLGGQTIHNVVKLYMRGSRIVKRLYCIFPLDFHEGVTYVRAMPKKRMPKDVREFFVKMGKQGGLLGGKIRAAKLTSEERSAAARKAVQARWAKRDIE
jgi:hypothetical protein